MGLLENLKQQMGDNLLIGQERYTQTIPTGIPPLDDNLGGGFAISRIIEFFGSESSGKTLIADSWLANVQKRGGVSGKNDTEGAHNSKVFERLGGNSQTLFMVPEEHGSVLEPFFDWMKDLMVAKIKEEKAGDTSVIGLCWDSVAATPSKHLVKEGMDKRDMSVSGSLSQGMKLVQKYVNQCKVSLLFINQVRELIDSKDSSMHTPGGRAVKFHSSQRLALQFDGGTKTCQILANDNKDAPNVGRWTKATVVKNRIGAPLGTCRLPIYTREDYPHPIYGTPLHFGIHVEEALFDYYTGGGYLFEGEPVLIRSGSWYSINEKLAKAKKFYAKDWLEVLEEVPRLRTLIYEAFDKEDQQAQQT